MLNVKNRKITKTGKEIIRKRNQVKKDMKKGDPVVFKLKKLLEEKTEKIKNLTNTMSALDGRVLDLEEAIEIANKNEVFIKEECESLNEKLKSKTNDFEILTQEFKDFQINNQNKNYKKGRK